ncbi:hypothetical protein BFP72_10115 [Reichenbachiella sp. 5M10]|uniref:hypothetical protein n=1 Tax=Reichenbachiella sp. 5M10 TaxID=1889772 RepID=UPI000C156B95|nr:hypothetical protein [Reichenbachiella sp. 5M10]PIB35722.1 hypothetical protein BFP72_10115 [Reichenbachiella sp. 5M10]
MQRIDYNHKTIAELLTLNGALRDIFILGSTLDDWNNVLHGLKNSDYGLDFLIDSEPAELPHNAEEIFKIENSKTLRVRQDNIFFNSYFFVDSEIDFDIDPRDFVAFEQGEDLVNFMRFLSNLTNKPCILTPELDQEYILMKILPNSSKIHV